ncbi:MAG: hypothetical protein JXB26_12655 [Candidatus Aminicenantes bacterium]|nr:hypothetical protein [Candidatus Aminicenantes bacterium]
MRLKRWLSLEILSGKKTIHVFGLAILAFLLITAGNTACKPSSEEEAPVEGVEEASAIKEGLNNFEGEVKVAEGKFIFIPNIKGFDIVVTGDLKSGDTTSLEGKQIRGQGTVSFDKPSIMLANTIEVKQEDGSWQVIYEAPAEQEFEEYLDLKTRQEYKALENIDYRKSEEWENDEKVKIYGALQEEGDSTKIAVFNEKGDKSGEVLVDEISDYARFYLKKLRLFDKFWFYCNVKETVPWSSRRRTQELFHADVFFAGLF